MDEENAKLLSPKTDVVFQVLFGEVGSEEITKSFLEAILKEKITEIDLSKNPILRRTKIKDKLGVLDVIAEINNKEICNIEMQVAKKDSIIQRILFYWAKLYSRNIQKSEKYNTLKRTIMILIADFEIPTFEDLGYLTKWKIIDEEKGTVILTDFLEIDIIELPKIYKEKGEKDDELLKWLHFLENPESKEVEYYMENNEGIKKAKEKLETISDDIIMQRLVDWREDAERDEAEMKEIAWNEGKEEGIKEEAKQIAKKMKEQNMDIELIMKITGLKKEEIEKL